MDLYLISDKIIKVEKTSTTVLQKEKVNSPKTYEIGVFSIFSKPVTNTLPSRTVSIKEVHSIIVNDRYEIQTETLRSISDKDRARSYKARAFDYACISGVFSKRSEAGLIQHSNLLTIDFDHVPNVESLKLSLINNRFFETVLAFISPSGDGLKWIVKIDLTRNTHLEWFQGIASFIRANYGLEIDKSGKDVSRCCFLPYDPNAYINENYI